MTVVGGRGSGRAEIGAAFAVSAQVPVPAVHVFAAELTEALDRLAEVLMFRINDRVRTIGGDDPALPPGLTNRSMVLQRVVSAFGRREQVDVEAVEQCARAEFRRGK